MISSLIARELDCSVKSIITKSRRHFVPIQSRVPSPESPAEVEALRRRLLRRDEDDERRRLAEEAASQSGAGFWSSSKAASVMCFGGVIALGAVLIAKQWIAQKGQGL